MFLRKLVVSLQLHVFDDSRGSNNLWRISGKAGGGTVAMARITVRVIQLTPAPKWLPTLAVCSDITTAGIIPQLGWPESLQAPDQCNIRVQSIQMHGEHRSEKPGNQFKCPNQVGADV